MDRLASQILAGPERTLATSRRVRLLLGSLWMADTVEALYVWESWRYPYFYLPASRFHSDVVWDSPQTVKGTYGQADISSLHVSDTVIRDVIKFRECHGVIGNLNDMVRVPFDAEGLEWFEEDTRIFVHPKDPFKRVDILPSLRPIAVYVDGELVATSDFAYHLHETGLTPRYYLPRTAVKPALLRKSATVTSCPYKGDASYFDLVLSDDRVYTDLIWYYVHPTLECSVIANFIAFYNEKVDIRLGAPA